MEDEIPGIINDSFSNKIELDLLAAKSRLKFRENVASNEDDTLLKATLLRHADPVQHTFSHIKKKYCPIYLVLEGGEQPPGLRAYVGRTKAKREIAKKRKTKRRKVDKGVIEISSGEEEAEDEDEVGGKERIVGELKWVSEEKMDEHMCV